MRITIETKYNIGDKVWYLRSGRIAPSNIRRIYVKYSTSHTRASVSYVLDTGTMDRIKEHYLYSSQGALEDALLNPDNVALEKHPTKTPIDATS